MQQSFPSSTAQLPFEFEWRECADFEHFVEGPNHEVCALGKAVALDERRHSIYFWGQPASGKTHLLQAICQLAGQLQRRIAYIPLRLYAELGPGILSDLEHLSLICVDDIDLIAGRDDWERALLYLYNRLREARQPLVMSARAAPAKLNFARADLKSRIVWDLACRLQPLNDQHKIKVLKNKARRRALELPDSVATYLVEKTRRDLPTLLALLDQFDRAALAEQRKLTIPFVRSLLR